MQQQPSTVVCTPNGLFVWPGIAIAQHGFRRSDQDICSLLACLHGHEVMYSGIVPTILQAADLFKLGYLNRAIRCVGGLPRLQLSPSGNVLMREIAFRLGVAAPSMQVRDQGQVLPGTLARKIALGFDTARHYASQLEPIFCAKSSRDLHKTDWDADKHPRIGDGPNPGWFAPVDHPSAAASAEHHQDRTSDAATVTPVADFSGGFHDAVVDAWIAAFNAAGTPAIKAPAIRMVGTGAVVGFPDILIKAPGVPAEAIEVKTGEFPTFTPNQAFYIPMLQLGEHIYSTDPRITQLGLTPGVPFPPMAVYVLYARGPGLPYGAQKLPGPKFSKGVVATAPGAWCAA